MKNPYLSLWLSEYNKAVNAAKGQMMAEAQRQQTRMMQDWTAQATEFWLKAWFPWMPQKTDRSRR